MPTTTLTGSCLYLKTKIRYHGYQGYGWEPGPKEAKEGLWPSGDLQRKNFLPFPMTVEILSAILPLNGSCLFIQHYCLTDTYSTWRLGNWSQTVWGRDEIFAPVKVLLKHKPDIILSFPHHTVTCFDSRMLRLISPKVNACCGRS